MFQATKPMSQIKNPIPLKSASAILVEKKLLSLDDTKEIVTDTVFVKVPSKPKETIVIKRDEVIKEIDCTEYYNDPKRDSLWSKRITKKDNP